MNQASMVLSKWNSNSKAILKESSPPIKDEDAEDSMKILGLHWNTLSDEFVFNFQKLLLFYEKLKPCKRTVLRIIQKIYDPLGLLSPYLITSKLILQNLCKMQLTWDEELPQHQLDKWNLWISELYQAKNVAIPRCVKVKSYSKIEIVGFCDASKHAYAAAVYLKCIDTNNEIQSNLIISKSRVSPMKPITIPRLELLGAILLVRLVSTVKNCLSSWNISNTIYYCDSMNVLYWIRGTRKWNIFVSKRLDEIYQLSSKSQWYYCPTEENPADYPTRGMTMNELLQSRQWLHGPDRIMQNNNAEDSCSITDPSEECLAEELKASNSYVSIVKSGIGNVIDIRNYNRYMKLLRVTAFVLMFIHIRIKKQNVTFLEMIELSERIWILNEQKFYYHEVLDVFNGKITKNTKNPVNQLSLFVDPEGIIRCSGRYKYTGMEYKLKYPILLPRQSHLTSMIVQHRHVKAKHAGMKTTLIELREDFWVPRARKLVQTLINKCIICRRINAKPFIAPPPPPLPPTRLSDLPPFTHTGVDYAGPLYLKERGCNDAYKAYIALFTCASSRAVHLELVPSMNSPAFKNCLSRFVSTWGYPRYIISDNAKSFKKTAEDLIV